MMTNYIFAAIGEGMADVDAKKVLSPQGSAIREATQGRRDAGSVEVAVHWVEIEGALDAGVTVAVIYRAMSKAGLVSVTSRSFARQVKARREGVRAPRAAARAVSEAVVEAEAAPEAKPEPNGDRPFDPKRPWRTGPVKGPDPHRVYEPRDPLAES